MEYNEYELEVDNISFSFESEEDSLSNFSSYYGAEVTTLLSGEML